MTTFTFDHVSLSVADLDAQSRFYGSALGLAEVEEEFAAPEAGVRSTILRSPSGLKIELVERSDSDAQDFDDPHAGAKVQGYFHWALNVTDIEDSFTQLLNAGARAVSGPAPAVRPGARFAYVKDPEGNLLELIQPESTD